jgi:hypothetical protein
MNNPEVPEPLPSRNDDDDTVNTPPKEQLKKKRRLCNYNKDWKSSVIGLPVVLEIRRKLKPKCTACSVTFTVCTELFMKIQVFRHESSCIKASNSVPKMH